MIYLVVALLLVVIYELQNVRQDIRQLGKTNLVVKRFPSQLPGIPRTGGDVRRALRDIERKNG